MNNPCQYLIVSIATNIDIGTKFYKAMNHVKVSFTTFSIILFWKKSS